MAQGKLYRKALDVLESEGYIEGWDGLGTDMDDVSVTDKGSEQLERWIEDGKLVWDAPR